MSTSRLDTVAALTSRSQRPIVDKQAQYAFYHPSAVRNALFDFCRVLIVLQEAVASMVGHLSSAHIASTLMPRAAYGHSVQGCQLHLVQPRPLFPRQSSSRTGTLLLLCTGMFCFATGVTPSCAHRYHSRSRWSCRRSSESSLRSHAPCLKLWRRRLSSSPVSSCVREALYLVDNADGAQTPASSVSRIPNSPTLAKLAQAIPPVNMLGWSSWMRYINPVYFAFESVRSAGPVWGIVLTFSAAYDQRVRRSRLRLLDFRTIRRCLRCSDRHSASLCRGRRGSRSNDRRWRFVHRTVL